MIVEVVSALHPLDGYVGRAVKQWGGWYMVRFDAPKFGEAWFAEEELWDLDAAMMLDERSAR